jgi:hypothetical protein
MCAKLLLVHYEGGRGSPITSFFNLARPSTLLANKKRVIAPVLTPLRMSEAAYEYSRMLSTGSPVSEKTSTLGRWVNKGKRDGLPHERAL